jgi:hypothetical protein
LTLAALFGPERAARLIEYHARANTPSLSEVIDAALAVNRPPQAPHSAVSGLTAQVQSAVYARTVESLLNLAANPAASVGVRAVVNAKLDQIKKRGDVNSPLDAYLTRRIQLLQNEPAKFVPEKPVEAPPGMPIGDEEW